MLKINKEIWFFYFEVFGPVPLFIHTTEISLSKLINQSTCLENSHKDMSCGGNNNYNNNNNL